MSKSYGDGITLAMAKRDHAHNLFNGFAIHDDNEGNWEIYLNSTVVFDEILVDARTKTIRKFKTLDAAIKTLREIGFPASRLEWHPENNTN